ncbi:MAG TPA: serine/threonine-protein kinase [Polyangiaceae bacterium]|jgi:serine/threonine-protein kinase|nr:serine/threonine-protein kinase [Polyangiaceae bacterium]
MRDVVVGEELDQYSLTELLARSGMASIFKAIDRETGSIVALKVPYFQLESDIVFHERFRREEDIGKRLDHPNIVKVLTPKKKSRLYLAMEFVDGTSLRALMEREPKMPEVTAVGLARQICDALVYMHARGVVHRDLKPENVLITGDGVLKILDFGIAMDEAARRLTWAGLSSTIGTPDYMAPEQIGGRRGDVRTDVYALGTILYEMVAGELPYAAPSAQAMMRAKTTADPEPPARHRPDITPGLQEIIMHAIARAPRDRYKTAAELLEDLREPSAVVPGSRTAHVRTGRGPSRRTVFTVAVVAVLTLLLVLVRFSGKSERGPKSSQPSYRGASP